MIDKQTSTSAAAVAEAPALPTHGWMVEIKIIAPDGLESDAYTREELMAIERARKPKV